MPEKGFTAAKIFVEGGLGAAKWFRRGRLVLQRNLDFAKGGLGLRNDFAEDTSFRRGAILAAKFSLANEFACFWAPLVP